MGPPTAGLKQEDFKIGVDYSHSEIDLEFSDGLVLIRPYRLDDADAIYEAVRESIPDLSPWVSWCHAYYSMEEAKFFLKAQAEWWKEGSVYNFAITDAEGGGFLGGCVLTGRAAAAAIVKPRA